MSSNVKTLPDSSNSCFPEIFPSQSAFCVNPLRRKHSFKLLTFALLFLIGLGTQKVCADDQSCNNLDTIGICGGPDRCYPEVDFLKANLEAVWTQGSNRFASFCVSAGGRAYGELRVSIHYQIVGFQQGTFTGCTFDPYSFLTCVSCSKECSYDTLSFSDTGGTVLFWAEASQGISISTCRCVSDTITISVPGTGEAPDTIPQTLPLLVELGSMSCEQEIGKPINASNGNKYYNQLDVSLPTDRGLPLALMRHYNSYDSLKGALSYNWSHSFEYHLSKDAAGSYTLAEPTGRIITFEKHVLLMGTTVRSISFESPYGVQYRFDEDTTGASVDTLTVIMEDETKLIFIDTGKIDFLKDLQGNAVNFFYTTTVLDSITNSSGRKFVFKYTAERLGSVLSSTGDTLAKYEYYAASSNLKKVVYPDANWEQYVYDTASFNKRRITSIQRSSGPSLNYVYDSVGRAFSFYKAGGKELNTLAWDVVESTCPDSILDSIATPNGTMVVASFWSPDYSKRDVVFKSDPNCSGCATKWTYNDIGLKETAEYANGARDSFFYDVKGNLLSAVYGKNTSLAQQIKYQHDSRFNRQTAEVKKSIANLADTMISTRFLYHANGTCTTMVDSGWKDGSNRFIDTTKFSYNSFGQVLKINGPRSNVVDTTGLAYYSNGDLQTITLANGDITTFGQRSDLGHRTWIRSPNGDTTRYTFNTRGRLTKVQGMSGTADSANTTFSYTVDGDILTTTSPIGGTLTFAYTAQGYVDSLINSRNWYIKYTYDSSGNPLTEKVYDSAGTLRREESYRYTTKNQLEFLIDANDDTTTFTYSNVGDINTVFDAFYKGTNIVYDSLRRVTQTTQLAGTGDTVRTKYFYDTRNNVTKVIDPEGYEYVYRYDDKNRLIVDSSAIYGKSFFGYDAASNLIWEMNAANDSIAYQYDALNRLTAVLYPDSQNIKYLYDGTEYAYGKGRLYKEITPACTTKYRYDARGRSYQVYQKLAGDNNNYGTTFTYDKNNNVTQIGYPSGVDVKYGYDNIDNVTKVEVWKAGVLQKVVADSVKYSPYGRPISWKLGNGIIVKNIYDKRYLVDSIWTGADNVMKWVYDINKVSNITQITDNVDTLQTRRFEYDDIYRLKKARSRDYGSGDTSISYVYSKNGNIDSVKVSKTQSYSNPYFYTNNKLDSVKSTSSLQPKLYFLYDNLGNATRRRRVIGINTDTANFIYNDVSRLIRIDSLTATGSVNDSFFYDARNRRVKEKRGSTGTKFIYNSAGQVMSEFELNGVRRTDFVYLNGILLAKLVIVQEDPQCVNPDDTLQSEGPGVGEPCDTVVDVYYYHTDHLGTPWYVTAQNKSIVWKGEYFPFGELYSETVTVQNPHRFPGQYKEQNTLYYNWNRYYDPKIGRYLQADPIGLFGGINLFSYVLNNPLRWLDMLGLYWEFSQSKGELNYVDNETGERTYMGKGYSGFGKGLNNPKMQHLKDIGPIPQGVWDIGPAFDDKRKGGLGPIIMKLTPRPETETFGRSGFFIHGDDPCLCENASHGCPVFSRKIRLQISNSSDREWRVVP